jgi:hypothetical protein
VHVQMIINDGLGNILSIAHWALIVGRPRMLLVRCGQNVLETGF